jgi:NAD-dependent DNA ligase
VNDRSFDMTWYVNPQAFDIRRINPYAAYNLSDDEWTVQPPDLPDWGPEKFAQGKHMFEEGRALISQVRAILRLPSPFREQEAKRIWDYIHEGRNRAFSEQGMGWQDISNVLEKMLSQAPGNLVERLKALVYPAGAMT